MATIFFFFFFGRYLKNFLHGLGELKVDGNIFEDGGTMSRERTSSHNQFSPQYQDLVSYFCSPDSVCPCAIETTVGDLLAPASGSRRMQLLPGLSLSPAPKHCSAYSDRSQRSSTRPWYCRPAADLGAMTAHEESVCLPPYQTSVCASATGRRERIRHRYPLHHMPSRYLLARQCLICHSVHAG